MNKGKHGKTQITTPNMLINEYWISKQNTFFLEHRSFIHSFIKKGALVVVVDMSMAMISVLFNLMVITSIRRKEEMMALTFNKVKLKLMRTTG